MQAPTTMNEHADKLSGKQVLALVSLMGGSSIEAAARAAGVDERTVYRWLKDENFSGEYRGRRRQAVEQAMMRLQKAADQAVATMLDIMQDPLAPAGVRLKAAETVYQAALKWVEVEDIAARIEALEGRA